MDLDSDLAEMRRLHEDQLELIRTSVNDVESSAQKNLRQLESIIADASKSVTSYTEMRRTLGDHLTQVTASHLNTERACEQQEPCTPTPRKQ